MRLLADGIGRFADTCTAVIAGLGELAPADRRAADYHLDIVSSDFPDMTHLAFFDPKLLDTEYFRRHREAYEDYFEEGLLPMTCPPSLVQG